MTVGCRRGRDPRVEASGAEWFEVLGVAGGDDHPVRLGDGGDQGVVERGMLGDAVRREHPGGGQVESQHAIAECS